MRRLQPEPSPYTKQERIAGAVAHGATLLIGLPVTLLLIPMPFSLAVCPVAAYLISRWFRRRRDAWGAFQGMQASVLQLLIFFVAILFSLAGDTFRLRDFLFLAGFLLFLYSLWGAMDTLMGFDFQYLGIGKLVSQVSQANLTRRRWSRRGVPEQDDRNGR